MVKKQRKKNPWEKKKKHVDTIHIKGKNRLSFSKGKNGFGARIDGNRIELKRKWM